MGGRHGAYLFCQKALQDGLRQRRALGGVSTRAQLVKERQIARRDLLHDGDDVLHMAGKGGKGLLDGLLIPDVGIYMIKNRHLRAQLGRHVQPGLRHQGKQPYRLERDGLAARVGAGDDKRGKLIPKPQIAGHHLLGIDQRMPPADDADIPALVELGQRCAHLLGQHALGKGEIQMVQDVDIAAQRIRVRCKLPGQRLQNAGDLLLFAGAQLFEVIAHFHHSNRLHKQRCACGALVMHDAGHIGAALCLDGDAVAIPAHCNDGVLQKLGVAAGVDHVVELIAHTLVGGTDLPADGAQLRAGTVGDFLLAEDGIVDFLLHASQRGQAGSQAGQDRGILPLLDQSNAGGARRAQASRHIQQRAGGKARALFRQGNMLAHIPKTDQRLPAHVGDQHHGLLRLGQSPAHFSKIPVGGKRFTQRCAHGSHAIGGKPFADLGKLQHAQFAAWFHVVFLLTQCRGVRCGGRGRSPAEAVASLCACILIRRTAIWVCGGHT